MATIKSQLVLNDGMSPVLRKITTALDLTLRSFEQVQRASGRAVDTTSIEQARSALVGVNLELDEMAEGYRRAAREQAGLSQGMDGLRSKAGGIAAIMGGGWASNKLFGLSDRTAGTAARLELIVEDGGSVEALEQKIRASAMRSRASYLDVSDSVAKLGLMAGGAFSGNDEIIRFTELMNKNFVVAGTSAQEQSAAMYQLNQAMASGRLQGDEYKSIIENAPLLGEAIEDYMVNVRGAEGSMKDWAAEGLLTAQVVKSALFSSADEIEQRFNKMPMTWGQVWNQMGNIALQVLSPVLDGINWLANNLDIIGPIVLGLAGAVLVFAAATKGAALATAAWKAVQLAFNAVMALNPIFLIIMGVMLLIGAIYAIVAAVNKATGSTVSATGIICGAFMTALAYIGNLFISMYNLALDVWVFLWDYIADFVNFLATAMDDPLAAWGRGFFDMADQALGVLEALASAVDTLFGSNLAGAVQGWRGSLGGWVDKTFGPGVQVMGALDTSELRMDRIEYAAAYDSGYRFGQGLDDKLGDWLGLGDQSQDGQGADANLAAIADNTGAMVEGLELGQEELAYMRDIAERDAINRFTTAEVKIDMTGMSNRIEGGADLDGVLSALTDGFTEALLTAAEGVHA